MAGLHAVACCMHGGLKAPSATQQRNKQRNECNAMQRNECNNECNTFGKAPRRSFTACPRRRPDSERGGFLAERRPCFRGGDRLRLGAACVRRGMPQGAVGKALAADRQRPDFRGWPSQFSGSYELHYLKRC